MKTNVVSDDWLFFACLAYGATAWLLQMYRVAAPRDWLLQRIKDIRARMKTDEWHGVAQALDNLAWHEQKLEKGWLFVPIPKVQAGWRYVHALEDDHVHVLSSDVVNERLKTVQCSLKSMRNSCAKQLAERIETMLGKADLEARRALLQEAQVYVHNVSDKKYEDMAALLAKAVLAYHLRACDHRDARDPVRQGEFLHLRGGGRPRQSTYESAQAFAQGFRLWGGVVDPHPESGWWCSRRVAWRVDRRRPRKCTLRRPRRCLLGALG